MKEIGLLGSAGTCITNYTASHPQRQCSINVSA